MLLFFGFQSSKNIQANIILHMHVFSRQFVLNPLNIITWHIRVVKGKISLELITLNFLSLLLFLYSGNKSIFKTHKESESLCELRINHLAIIPLIQFMVEIDFHAPLDNSSFLGTFS